MATAEQPGQHKDAFRMAEIIDRSGLPRQKCLRLVKEMMGRGDMECIWLPYMTIANVEHKVPHYRLIKKEQQ